MQKIISEKRADTGAPIDDIEVLYLKKNFTEKFPEELQSIFIKNELIEQVFKENVNCCGIRFTYGMTSVGDAASKLILLVPCYSEDGIAEPKAHITIEGYISHTGERITLLKVFDYIGNYVLHQRNLMPSLALREVPRSCFFGINKIKSLIDTDTVTGINYYFGYDPQIEAVPLRYRIVLETEHTASSATIKMDHGSLYPPLTGGDGFDDCIITNATNLVQPQNSEEKLSCLRAYRDNKLLAAPKNAAMVEMYYHISPAIAAKIDKLTNKDEVYKEFYDNDIAACEALLKQGENEKAKEIFENSLQDLLSKYLLN